jgi:hypothetical protein
MKYRKLRIAWSLGCGILCLLLIVLWARTYFAIDHINGQLTSSNGLGITSRNGGVGLVIVKGNLSPWRIRSYPASEPIQLDYERAMGFIQYQAMVNQFIRVRLPYSSLVILCATSAALPWIRWSKQFSLRTVLILITLLGLALGLIIATTR